MNWGVDFLRDVVEMGEGYTFEREVARNKVANETLVASLACNMRRMKERGVCTMRVSRH